MTEGGITLRLQSHIKSIASRFGVNIERFPPTGSLAAHLARVFRRFATDTVIDVGANRGQYGLMLRSIGYTGKLISYEPVPTAFGELASAAESDPVWIAHNLAVGDKNERSTINIAASSTVSSLSQPTAEYASMYPGSRIVGQTQVRAVRLDDDIFKHSAVNDDSHIHLKIDTQSHDMKVLAGASELLRQVASLQVELSFIPLYEDSTPYGEMIEWITRRGFSLSNVFPVMIGQDLRLYEADGIFVSNSANISGYFGA